MELPDISPKMSEILLSFLSHAERKGSLSPSQENWFLKIEKANSPEERSKRRKWELEYSEEHKIDATIMANYYIQNPPYFGDLATKVIEDRNYVLTENQFNKMCRNKYAARVIEQSKAQAKYPVGSMVQIRTTSLIRRLNPSVGHIPGNSYAAVLEVNAKPISRASKGAKIYKILPMGSTPVYAHESDIKKARKVK